MNKSRDVVPPPIAPPPQTYNIRQTAAIFQVTPATILNWIYEGRIAAFKIGRAWRIDSREIERRINNG